MWTKSFWKATTERVVRGGAAAVAGGLFAGDWVFDVMSVNTWNDALSLFVGGGLASLVFSLAGNAITGDGPAFTNEETLS
jgi:hypothetical protein